MAIPRGLGRCAWPVTHFAVMQEYGHSRPPVQTDEKARVMVPGCDSLRGWRTVCSARHNSNFVQSIAGDCAPRYRWRSREVLCFAQCLQCSPNRARWVCIRVGVWPGPPEQRFGWNSNITQGVRESSYTSAYRTKVRVTLAQGGKEIEAGRYKAGTPGLDNEKFIRDMITAADSGAACNVNQSLLAIGSFRMNAQVAQFDKNTAKGARRGTDAILVIGSRAGDRVCPWREGVR